MDERRTFVKWYNRVNVEPNKDVLESRWRGIQSVLRDYNEKDSISLILRIYFEIYDNKEGLDEFNQYFIDEDEMFEEENKEEIIILAGCTLMCLLDENIGVLVALYLIILSEYYDNPIPELLGLAKDVFKESTKEYEESEILDSTKILNDIQNKLDELDKYTEEVEEVEEVEEEVINTEQIELLTELVKLLSKNMILINDNNIKLIEKNKKYQEKTRILSWLLGEWSDILEAPLKNVNDINGAFVVGIELADLIEIYPGPYATSGFLNKMIGKCKKVKEKYSLIELIDSQDEKVREIINDKYIEGNKSGYLNPILSAIKMSLEVSGPREWVPAYSKKLKINPDELQKDLLEWSMLIYQECIITNC